MAVSNPGGSGGPGRWPGHDSEISDILSELFLVQLRLKFLVAMEELKFNLHIMTDTKFCAELFVSARNWLIQVTGNNHA